MAQKVQHVGEQIGDDSDQGSQETGQTGGDSGQQFNGIADESHNAVEQIDQAAQSAGQRGDQGVEQSNGGRGQISSDGRQVVDNCDDQMTGTGQHQDQTGGSSGICSAGTINERVGGLDQRLEGRGDGTDGGVQADGDQRSDQVEQIAEGQGKAIDASHNGVKDGREGCSNGGNGVEQRRNGAGDDIDQTIGDLQSGANDGGQHDEDALNDAGDDVDKAGPDRGHDIRQSGGQTGNQIADISGDIVDRRGIRTSRHKLQEGDGEVRVQWT